MVDFPFQVPVLRVDQPLGLFYVAVLPAELLLQVARSDAARAYPNANGSGYTLEGNQRFVKDARLTQIAEYINREDAAFPNSIILAANYDLAVGFDQEEIEALRDDEKPNVGPAVASIAWKIESLDERLTLTIPTDAQLAAVIDGQHRLFAFAKADSQRQKGMDLICSIFIDLPKPYQAELFARINSTQTKVSKSLTYDLFGYNVDDEPEALWSPEKLAVFLTRKLATEQSSPLRRRIIVAPKHDGSLGRVGDVDWKISTAVVVDGILRLISSNPRRDSNLMNTGPNKTRSVLNAGPKDKTVLREAFIQGNDLLIFKTIENFLSACQVLFWATSPADSFIRKTVGVQALFDVLRALVPDGIARNDLRNTYFIERLRAASEIDFSTDEFKNASGAGRTNIKNKILESLQIAAE